MSERRTHRIISGKTCNLRDSRFTKNIFFIRKYLISLFTVLFIICSINTTAFAEVDPAKLMEILSALAGTGITINNTGTVATATGTAVSTSTGTNQVNITSTGTNSATTPESNEPEYLNISVNTTGKVGELLNVTVTALKKNGTVATNYRGTVFISVENDYTATVPYKDGYAFSTNDQGRKIFTNGLSFSKTGTFKLSVIDYARSKLIGSTSINISGENAVVVSPVINDPIVNEPTITEEATTTTPAVLPTFKILKVETGDRRATINFRVLNETSDIRKFEILYADPEGISKKSITYEKEKIRTINGDYTWYIPELDFTKYVISIAGVNKDGEIISGIISKPFEADLSLFSAGKCIIPNVTGLRTVIKNNTSFLYWNYISGAIDYKIYKKNVNGEYVFVAATKKNSYSLHITEGEVNYEEFSIKAVCSDGTESLKFSPSTNVQTGPSIFILFIIISSAISAIIMRRRKQIFGKF